MLRKLLHLFLLLKKYAFKPVIKLLEDRRKVIDDGVKMGEKLAKEQTKFDAKLAETMSKAREEADHIIATGHKEAREVVREAEQVRTEEASQHGGRPREQAECGKHEGRPKHDLQDREHSGARRAQAEGPEQPDGVPEDGIDGRPAGEILPRVDEKQRAEEAGACESECFWSRWREPELTPRGPEARHDSVAGDRGTP